jgi:microsomal dipeptidase-like Zn-dependent dipeptidase
MLTVDLHCHPNLKSFNSGKEKPAKNLWENIAHKIDSKFAQTVGKQTKQIYKESQSNFYRQVEGNVRVFNISLYPIERGFLHLNGVSKSIIGKNRINTLHEVVTGYDGERIKYMMTHDDYFADLIKEYHFVEKAIGKSPDGKYEFVLVNNYAELQAALKKENTLIGIISIEGAHALGTGNSSGEELAEQQLLDLITKNVATIKQWKFPPLTINLAHHFWNQLSGHSTTFKPPINRLITQAKGKDTGITKAGWHTIRQFLSKENGKRILIDTKHMSVAARKEYYNFIATYNHVNPNDVIPIVCSHTGIGGFETMDKSIKDKDIFSKAKNSRLYNWSINISDEEIRIIHQSQGIIGLMVDKGMLGGFNEIKKISAIADNLQQRKAYTKLFWDNVFQIVRAIDNETAWSVVSLGTDFDGTITHMEPYESSSKLPLFQNDLIEFLETTNYRKELWYHQTPRQMVSRIMHENALNFYRKFFV